jgi:hypothetical protein
MNAQDGAHRPTRGFRLGISPKGRHFTDPRGQPWFFLGDTQWELFRMFSPQDARELVETRISQGFRAFLVMLNGVPEGGNLGLPGPRPWAGGRPPRIDKSYFQRVDAIIDQLAPLEAVFVVGVFHKAEASLFHPATARTYARTVARRYRDVGNLVWCMYPEAGESYRPICREIASGLREGDGGSHLITVHPDPSPGSSTFFAGESWIDFNMLQVCVGYERLYELVRADYESHPTRPAVMAEGGYEGTEFGRVQRAHEIRKQAYWSHFAGGHHVYGHNDNYASPTSWRSWVRSEGAEQLRIYREAVTSLEGWWNRVPDQSLIASGAGVGLDLDAACRGADRSWALVYLSGPRHVRIRAPGGENSRAEYRVAWVDPRSGERVDAGSQVAGEVAEFSTPTGWEDAVIELRSVRLE